MLVDINASDEQIADVRKELYSKCQIALNNGKIFGIVRDIIWTIHNLYLCNKDMKYTILASSISEYL
jgi:hypothetical protein